MKARLIALILALAVLVVILILFKGLATGAQQAKRVYLIGVLLHDGAPPGLLEAFREGLHELGYVEGKNITIALRDGRVESWRQGQAEGT